MGKIDERTARKLHRSLWDWLAKTGGEFGFMWPEWAYVEAMYGSVLNHCFACEVTPGRKVAHTGEICESIRDCEYCPLAWERGEHCGTLLDSWQNEESTEERKALAAQIRDLPWKGISDIRPGDRVRIRGWDDMAAEFGLYGEGEIAVNRGFLSSMKYLCGQVGIVSEKIGEYIYIKNERGDSLAGDWSISPGMLELLEAVDDDPSFAGKDPAIVGGEKPEFTAEEYNLVISDTLARCKDVLLKKREEYATDDIFHNFNVAAELEGVSPKAALAGMMAKHTVSVYDMCFSNKTFPTDQWDEKICDHINYLLILRAMVSAEKGAGNNVD